MLDLTGKVAIVTGAGSVGPGWGNGKATAVLLARQGAHVFLVDINAEAVAETKAIIESEGKSCAATTGDMMDGAQVKDMVEACVTHFGKIDILVNNVGGSEPGDAVTQTEEAFDRQIDFNLKTAFWVANTPFPIWKNRARARSSISPPLQGSGIFAADAPMSAIAHPKQPLSSFRAQRLGPLPAKTSAAIRLCRA